MLKRFGLDYIFVLDGIRAFWATPFLRFSRPFEFCISAQEGRSDLSDIAKCSQWPHLYMTYESTYALKCLYSEIWPKNWFLARRSPKFRRFLVFRPRKVVAKFPIQQNVRNSHIIYIWLMNQHMTYKSTYALECLHLEIRPKKHFWTLENEGASSFFNRFLNVILYLPKDPHNPLS